MGKSGADWSRDSRKWLRRAMRIDRDLDTYQEIVVDPDTGEVVHSEDEPLSSHTGHGSARGLDKK